MGAFCARAAGTTARNKKQERRIATADALFHPLRICMKCSSVQCVLEIRQATARSLVDDTTGCQCASLAVEFRGTLWIFIWTQTERHTLAEFASRRQS